ncbi:MAG TPA: transcriptional regulator [Phototrophicaceae bacterium]|nr:transcriptional regulator [Phototrophicaceae bacterium]
MTTPFESLAGLDRLVHEPARMAILTALAACKSADFLFLQNLTGLTKGNLSTHLTRLEEGKLIEVVKEIVGKKMVTRIVLTEPGRAAINQHWQRLQELRDQAEQWQAEEPPPDETA